MADQEIKTGIDALVTYLNEHGDTNISIIATALGVGEASVLEWANVLEQANVIVVSHRSGRLFLAPMTGAAKATKETVKAEQSRTDEIISSNLAAVDQISSDLEEFTKSLGKIDEVFNTKYKDAKVMLDKLNGIETNIARIEKNIDARANYIKTVSEKSKAQVDAAKLHLSTLSNFSLDTNNAKAVTQELKDLLKGYEKNTSELSKGLELMVYQYRKNAFEYSKNIKEKHRQLIEVLSFDEKQIREYERIGQDYKRERARLERQMDSISKKTLDEMEKEKAEMERLIELSRVQMNSIMPRVDEIKGDLGQLSTLNSQITGLRSSISELAKQKEALLPEIRKLQQENKSDENTQKVADEAQKASETITSIRGKVEELKKDFDNIGKKSN